jgi:hypothetical protein
VAGNQTSATEEALKASKYRGDVEGVGGNEDVKSDGGESTV